MLCVWDLEHKGFFLFTLPVQMTASFEAITTGKSSIVALIKQKMDAEMKLVLENGSWRRTVLGPFYGKTDIYGYKLSKTDRLYVLPVLLTLGEVLMLKYVVAYKWTV